MRIDRLLSESNICSRSEAKQYIKKGRVSVDGIIIKDPSCHVDESASVVTVDGKAVFYEKYHYYMLNKPAGCVSATKDGLSDTVVEILKDENIKGLFPVGRLDKDTEGLLLITDDGALAHKLTSPKHHVEKVYYVETDLALSKESMQLMESGVDIGDEKITLPAKVTKCDIIPHGDEMLRGSYAYQLTITEGRFHQVKRMFEACDSRVIYLKRLKIGGLILDESLREGKYRRLTKEELDLLNE